MTRRENRTSRRGATREERPQVLIVCGAESTEPAYFRGLRAWVRNSAVRIDILAKPLDPVALVRYTAARRQAGGHDQAWCVVDVDQFDLESAVTLAAKMDVRLAISNPCFEYWLLLHFEDCAAPLTCYRDVRPRLIRHLPAYRKNDLRFTDLAPGLEVAIERARARCPEHGREHQVNPSSGVWALVLDVLQRV